MVETVLVDQVGSVTTILINRPEARNAVDGPTAHALADAFRAFDEDVSTSVAVLSSVGPGFCAGADLKSVGTERMNHLTPVADGDGPMGPTRMTLTKPVIAAVHGHAVAGGLELALWCDLRVADTTAVFGVFCRRWGVPLIDGGTVRLPRLIGQSRAMDLILTGRPVAAEEAYLMGLANRVVPAGTALSAAQELARQVAAFPQTCVRTDRASVLEQWTSPDPMATEFSHGEQAMAEAAAGAARFTAGAGRHGTFD